VRHEQLHKTETYDRVELAPTVQKAANPEHAAQDVPVAVGALIATSYFVLIGTFALATTGSAYSHFMIVIDVVFLAAFFAVPWLFLRMEPKVRRTARFDQFLRNGIETATGRVGGGEVLIQMLIVPVLLTLAAIVIGLFAAYAI